MSNQKRIYLRVSGKLKSDLEKEINKSGKTSSEIQREALRAFLDEKQKRLGNRIV